MNITKNKKVLVKDYVFLHLSIALYSITSVLAKAAANYTFLSVPYILIFGGMIFVLGIYALLWQQAIRPFKPSVAYSNKSVTTIWILIASALIYREGISIRNLIGTILIILGVVMVSSKDE